MDAIDLNNTKRCPVAAACEACGTTGDLAVAILDTPVGVTCLTLCDDDVDVEEGTALPDATRRRLELSWSAAIERTGQHCMHLGITLDQMADQLEAARDGFY